jgi:hypothetical protein
MKIIPQRKGDAEMSRPETALQISAWVLNELHENEIPICPHCCRELNCYTSADVEERDGYNYTICPLCQGEMYMLSPSYGYKDDDIDFDPTDLDPTYGHSLVKDPYMFIPDTECNMPRELINWRHALHEVKKGTFVCLEHYFWKKTSEIPTDTVSVSVFGNENGQSFVHGHYITWGLGINVFYDGVNALDVFPHDKWIFELAESDISDDEFIDAIQEHDRLADERTNAIRKQYRLADEDGG